MVRHTSISWPIFLEINVLSYDCNINVLICLTYYYLIGFRILEWVKVWCIVAFAFDIKVYINRKETLSKGVFLDIRIPDEISFLLI